MVELIVAGLAAYRLGRMVAYERGFFDCFELMRQWVESGTEEDGWLRYGITCPLCLGFWFSVLFVVVPQWVALPFAVAGVQTLLQKLDWYIKYQNEVLWEMRNSYKYRTELNKRYDTASNDVAELMDADAAKCYIEHGD